MAQHPILYLALATLFSGVSFALVKFSVVRLHPLISNVIFGVMGLVVQLSVLWYFVKARNLALDMHWGGVWTALLGGIAGGLYIVFLFLTFQKADIARAAPVLYIGSLFIVVIAGTLFFGESLKAAQVAGLMLGSVSIVLLLI